MLARGVTQLSRLRIHRGFAVCLAAPYATESLHFQNFLLHREKDAELRPKSVDIRVKNDTIEEQQSQILKKEAILTKAKEQLSFAQNVVSTAGVPWYPCS